MKPKETQKKSFENQKLKRVAAIKKANHDFDTTIFTEQDLAQYVDLCKAFCNLSPTVTKYMFMKNREAFLLASTKLIDPSKCGDQWFLFFVRKMNLIGLEKLQEMINASGKELFKIVFKWYKNRRREYNKKCAARTAEKIRISKLRAASKKAKEAKPVLQATGVRQPRRKTIRTVLH